MLITFFFFSSINHVLAAAAPRNAILNPESSNLPKPLETKAEAITKKNKLALPEGSRVIKGMNIPLVINEINIYGFDVYKGEEGVRILKERLADAVDIHNKTSEDRAIKKIPQVIPDKENNRYKIVIDNKDEGVYLSLVYALTQQLTKQYQDDKYFLSRAVVPAQEINKKAGKIDVCVIEGYLPKDPAPTVEVKTGGKKLVRLKEIIEERLDGIIGKEKKPLSFNSFEREVLLIRDMSGVDIKTTFQQITQRVTKSKAKSKKAVNCQQALEKGMGKTRLLVALDVKKMSGSIDMDNYGIKSSGPEFLRFNINGNSILQAGDQYSFETAVSLDGKELKNYGVTAKLPLHKSGLQLNVSHRIGDAAPGDTFAELAIESKTATSEIGLEYPALRSRRENLSLSGKIKYQDIETDLLDASFVRDSIRTFHTQVTYDRADASDDMLNNGVNIISFEAVRGLNKRDSTQLGDVLSSRPEANPTFTRFVMEAKRFQNLPSWQAEEGFFSTGRFQWINSIKLQHASRPLFASEEFELGGRGYGRGFDIGVISGDKGLGITTQLEYAFSDAMGNWTLYNFLDYGKITNVDNSDKNTDQEEVELSSTGVGVSFQHNDNWYVNTELAKPLTISGDRDTKGHVYIGLGYRY